MKKGEWHIEITPYYAIGSDSLQYIGKTRANKVDKAGEPIEGEYGNWINRIFHADFNQLCRSLKARMHRECDVRSMNDLYKAAIEIDELFSKRHFLEFSETKIKEPVSNEETP